ncbi:hypothetical protein PMKS-002089 [Pichia membranifaciens]|uniref:Uncharacterized protein n=1 Tax=Pichia membranifaciens TaxID=4926 RepID=A0A1Q2YGA7_9ASCO|nr:hypothetical protein PMKS-002089 [Pichia membranifaciens]
METQIKRQGNGYDIITKTETSGHRLTNITITSSSSVNNSAICRAPKNMTAELMRAINTEDMNPTLIAIRAPSIFAPPTKLAIRVDDATAMANGIMYNNETTDESADCVANAEVPNFEANRVRTSYAMDSARSITIPGKASLDRSYQ